MASDGDDDGRGQDPLTRVRGIGVSALWRDDDKDVTAGSFAGTIDPLTGGSMLGSDR